MKIICIGRNYANHAKEMGSQAPSEPIFFFKPDTSILKDGNDFYYPDFTSNLHYECELVYRIDKPGKHIAEKFAKNYYSSFTLGIDFTARDLQERCKNEGLPWEMAKAFEHSAPISTEFIPLTEQHEQHITFELHKNGVCVQQGNSSDMLFNIDQLIAHISKYVTLKTGDLIYTGTPEGVGPVAIGDVLTGFVGDKKLFEFTVK